MPFEIIRNDITNMKVDAIVNTANPKPIIGSGVDSAIHQKAGPLLLRARQQIGDIAVGDGAVTAGYDLDARYVIHVVGPVWQGGIRQEAQLLRRCYDRALELAAELKCQSIAFPLISSGVYGYPKAEALQIALEAFSRFLMDHEMQIYLVVFNKEAFALSEELFASVSSYIDEHYVQEKTLEEYGHPERAERAAERRRKAARQEMPTLPDFEDVPLMAAKTLTAPMVDEAPVVYGLEEMLRAADVGFSEKLLQLIDRSGKTDAEIYKRANIDRKLFSKIRKNKAYKPSKTTAVAFAIALELDLAETQDLIGRAGFALTHSSKFDIIVEYFILQKNYDIMEINETLFYFDQSLLGTLEK